MSRRRSLPPNDPPSYVLELVATLETDPVCIFFFQKSWAVIATSDRVRSMMRALADPKNIDAAAIWAVLRDWAPSSTDFGRTVKYTIGEAVICERDAFESPIWSRNDRTKADQRVVRSARRFAAAVEAHPQLADLPAEYIWRKSEIDGIMQPLYQDILEMEETYKRIGFSESDLMGMYRHWTSYNEVVKQVVFNKATISQLTRQLISFVESMPMDSYAPRPKARTAKAVRFQRLLAHYVLERHPLATTRELATVVHGLALCAFSQDQDLAGLLSLEGTLELVKASRKPKPNLSKSTT